MVVKALITGATKYKPKPILKTKGEAKSLLQEAQTKIEKVKSGELKIKRPTQIVPDATDEILKDGQGITLPTKITKKDFKVTPPKANIKKATEFLDEERRIIESTESLKPEIIDGINIKTIQSSDDVLRSIEIIARQDKSKIVERTGGVVSRKETDELSLLINEDNVVLYEKLSKLRPGSALNAKEIRATKRLLLGLHQRLNKLATELLSENGGSTKQALEFAQAHALTVQVQRVFKGAQTEIARALNILQEPVQAPGSINIQLDELNRNNILLELGGKNQIEKIAELYLKTPGVAKQVSFLEKSMAAKTSDAVVEMFLNNILVMGWTHTKNIGGNWIFKTMHKLERLYAARRWGGKELDGIAEFEDAAQAFGEHLAASGMFRAFKFQLKNLKVTKLFDAYRKFPGFDSIIKGSKIEAPPNAFSAEGFGMQKDNIFSTFVDVAGRIFTLDRLPYKWLKNADNYFKNGAYQGEVYALAFRETIKQIKQGKLTKETASDYLASLIINPPPSFTKLAYETALEKTFQTQSQNRGDVIGDIASSIQKFKQSRVMSPLTWLSSQFFTFIRTPSNIAGAAIERSPGLNRILRSYRTDLDTPGAKSQLAKAKAAMGWAFLMTFVPLGYFGWFSGSDPEIRGREGYPIRQAGNLQPKSFRFHNFLSDEFAEMTGLVGKKLQLNLTGFEPAVLIASNAADIGALMRMLYEDHNNWDDLYDFALGYALAIGDNIGNSTFMQGTANLLDAVQSMRMSSDKIAVARKELKKIGARLVPFQFLFKQFNDLGAEKFKSEKWGNVNKDDFQKLNLEFISMIKRNFPGFENDLFLEYDWLGDEVQKFGVFTAVNEHPVNKEARNIGYIPTPLRKKIQVSVDSYHLIYPTTVQVTLEEREYKMIEKELGKRVKQKLTTLINSDEYKDELQIEAKKSMMAEEVGFAKDEIREELKTLEIWDDIFKRAEEIAKKKIRAEQKGFPPPNNKQTETMS